MKTCKEMALIWNISVRAVSNLCKSGRIPGAVKTVKNGRIQIENLCLLVFQTMCVLNRIIIMWIKQC